MADKIFALLEQKVWTAAAKDSVGLEAYYSEHKEEFMWGERVDATIFDCANEAIAKEVRKALKKKKTNAEILAQFNTDSTYNVFIDQGLFLPGQNSNVDMMNKTVGIGENILSSDGTVMFVKINSIVPPQPKTLKEARGYVISGYQDQLEKQWMQELQSKYPVHIDQDVFNSMVK
ncbi:MAG: peptidyl-prolyl cis-trans isomerase [Chitinophagales bacterium]